MTTFSTYLGHKDIEVGKYYALYENLLYIILVAHTVAKYSYHFLSDLHLDVHV